LIKIKDLSLQLGGFSLKQINLEIEAGDYFVILGPTGIGKTILLEAIAGIHKIRGGEIWIDGTNVTWLPPEHRKIGEHETHEHRNAIEQRMPVQRHRDTNRQTKTKHEDDARKRKHTRIDSLRPEDRCHRRRQLDRHTEVALKEIPEPPDVANMNGLIEAEIGPHAGNRLGVARLRAKKRRRRIAGEQLNQRKDDEAHAQERQPRQQEALDDELCHSQPRRFVG